MAIIKQLDKRSGITYVYDSKSYRDPDEYSDAKVHPFRKFRAPFSGKAEHTFPE